MWGEPIVGGAVLTAAYKRMAELLKGRSVKCEDARKEEEAIGRKREKVGGSF